MFPISGKSRGPQIWGAKVVTSECCLSTFRICLLLSCLLLKQGLHVVAEMAAGLPGLPAWPAVFLVMNLAIHGECLLSHDSSKVPVGEGSCLSCPRFASVPEIISMAWGLCFSDGPSLSDVPSPTAGREVSFKYIYRKEFPIGVVTGRSWGEGKMGG